MTVQSVTSASKRPSKAVVTNGSGKPKAKPAKKAAAKPKVKKPAKKSGDSASRQLVQLAVRNLNAEPEAFFTKAKGKGIKCDESRARAVFARVKFIVSEFKAAR